MSLQDSKSLIPAFGQQASHVFAPLQREIDRLFGEFGRGFEAFVVPSLDFSETAQGVELKLDVPGFKDSEIAITVDGDILTIAGEKASETEDKSRTYRVVERRSGAFSRSISLPRAVDSDKIAASLANGVLTITAPKAAEAGGRTIAIQAPKAAHAA